MYTERATGLILPDGVKTGRALRQEAAERALISAINSGYSHYGASRTKANVRGWNSYSGSAKEDIEDNLDLLRQRSRDAYMGIPSATAALKTLRTNVIAGGLMPSPQIDGDYLKMSSEQVEELQAKILREFSLWADSTACDADRVDDFYGLQQLAFLSSLMNGDAFATLTLKPRPQQPYDLRVRLIEADRVCSPNYRDRMTRGTVLGRDVGSIVQGVETDEDGEIVAYWIANKHPRSYTTLKEQDWKRVEVYGKKTGMRNVLHIMQRERAGQRRGVPILAPVLETLKQLERYAEAETTAALLGAIFTVFVKKGSITDEGPFGQMMRDELLKRMAGGGERDPNDLELGAGLIMDLEMGESVDTVETQHPHSGYDTFMMARMKQASSALEIPVNVLYKHFDVNFSCARGALNEFWRTCGMMRDWFSEDFCQPIYEMWFTEAVARGRIDAPGYFDDPAIRKAYTDCKWNGPARTAMNPSQEVEAAMKRVEAGFSTAAEETAQLTGGDYNRNIKQRLVEAKQKREVTEASAPPQLREPQAQPDGREKQEEGIKMAKKFWQFRNAADGSGELLLYGDIAPEKTWYGDEVTPKEFAEDLDALGAVSNITVRINSGGGDVFAAVEIGNLLEQHPANVTARIGGVCASAATIIACHCNKVIAANDSTYMVHPVKMGLFGYADAETLQQYIDAIATIRENTISLYAKKTGREKDEVAGWMDATKWWTGPQAKENGFVDELADEGQRTVYENRGGVLFVNSISMGLSCDKAPKFVQDSLTAGAAGRPANKEPAGQPEQIKEVQDMDIKTVDDLRKAYPALVDQIEQAAVNAERERIKGIEDVALPGSEELTAKAKFESPMSVSDFAVALVKGAKTKGAAFLDAMRKDGEESGAEDVGNPPAPGGEDPVNKAKAQAKADAEAYLERTKGRK